MFEAQRGHDLLVEELVAVAGLRQSGTEARRLELKPVVAGGGEQGACAVGIILKPRFAGPRRGRQRGVRVGLQVDVVEREAGHGRNRFRERERQNVRGQRAGRRA